MSTSSGTKVVREERSWYVANEILAFLIELAALACLTWWGFAGGGDAALRVVLGVGTPLLAMALWVLFAAPKARLRPQLPLVLVVKAMVLGGGAAALYAVRHPVAAAAMAVIVVANTAVAEIFRCRPGTLRTGQSPGAGSPASG
ncbi:YrdB family protein [Streptomyces sp. MUM 16J]|uniref:YrdB family protein n=1 Tax=Streptomyces sp. MUM 16J TaxID=2791988 RepID=UPI001F03EF59|nr:YrdB family protein [Streptomyces sp. MUM 16J]MCH0558192.1 YrdB family protein [Streptomyces sp. MUM 16J]